MNVSNTKPKPRYTIQMSVHRVDAEGDIGQAELAGCTLDFATTDFNAILLLLDRMYILGQKAFEGRVDGIVNTNRRPEGA